MAPVITSMDQLRALIAEHDAREAIAFAATGPVEQATTVSARRLAAEAPALPPLRMPKLTDKTLNGARVRELLAAGPAAVLVHTTVGVRVVEDVTSVAHDRDVIVLAEHDEVAPGGEFADLAPLTAAQRILDRELDVIARLEKAAA